MFRLTIDTDNDWFKVPNTEYQPQVDAAMVAGILGKVEGDLRLGRREGKVMDYNGNTVGQWTLDAAPDTTKEG